jgi:hypothetical protein
LLLSAGASGRTAKANERWISFVVLDRSLWKSVEDASRGLLLIWEYWSDYGLGLRFSLEGKAIGQLSFVWETALSEHPPGADLPENLLQTLSDLDVLAPAGLQELKQIATDVRNGLRGYKVRERVARVLDIPAYDQLSPELAIETDIDDFRESFPDAEDVEPVN